MRRHPRTQAGLAVLMALLSFAALAETDGDADPAAPLVRAWSAAMPLRFGQALDDTTLAAQHGRAVGTSMLATLRTGGGAVTLWDEIAPPRPPVPLPAGASRPLQGSRISYLRR
ncbi:hypothetical protein [Burkholderia gladioli]|uniref:Uncharacterized protein n=1 Tax=Burkholderia gladioli (strain BSR3) TaxID=999541 RepID=F2L7Z0_BURGS|nr:hypothetical protein [Burkholderia gladioli]AEA59685.1 hypothetical protein bgla_1g10030 [Burkholderia gladioli BSR3]MBA1362027.1 hypothetical protein [Burkholderia gladioli]MBU9270534.1 hypothetical protein [Burkholderia gladioli]MBW5284538.1 hypothetical protein [Burkholderia gladioli]MCA8169428.1 hypothetical protein [Burkholderia gladioli]